VVGQRRCEPKRPAKASARAANPYRPASMAMTVVTLQKTLSAFSPAIVCPLFAMQEAWAKSISVKPRGPELVTSARQAFVNTAIPLSTSTTPLVRLGRAQWGCPGSHLLASPGSSYPLRMAGVIPLRLRELPGEPKRAHAKTPSP